MRPAKILCAAAAALALTGCATAQDPTANVGHAPIFPARTASEKELLELPPPDHPMAVAVYNFTDQTGQFKPTDTGQTLSRAISQGGASMLVKSLQQAGGRKWFTVVEREQFKDLLTERQLIQEMRQRYLGENQVNPQALPALLFAGVLLEGGVIGYDTSTRTGGVGAGYLGISANAKYREDTVTVYLRAVSVKTGEVLASVRTSKTIQSRELDTSLFQYVAVNRIAQFESGFTTNEPGQLALQQAIDKAVYAMIMEGADLKLWSFADSKAGWPLLWRYRQERDGVYTPAEAEAAKKAGKAAEVAKASTKTPLVK